MSYVTVVVSTLNTEVQSTTEKKETKYEQLTILVQEKVDKTTRGPGSASKVSTSCENPIEKWRDPQVLIEKVNNDRGKLDKYVNNLGNVHIFFKV